MEDQESLGKVLPEAFLKLPAQSDLRHKVKHVPPLSERVLGQFDVYFRLSGAGDPMQQDWLACFESFPNVVVCLCLSRAEFRIRAYVP